MRNILGFDVARAMDSDATSVGLNDTARDVTLAFRLALDAAQDSGDEPARIGRSEGTAEWWSREGLGEVDDKLPHDNLVWFSLGLKRFTEIRFTGFSTLLSAVFERRFCLPKPSNS